MNPLGLGGLLSPIREDPLMGVLPPWVERNDSSDLFPELEGARLLIPDLVDCLPEKNRPSLRATIDRALDWNLGEVNARCEATLAVPTLVPRVLVTGLTTDTLFVAVLTA